MSANENDVKLSGSFRTNKDDRAGANTIPSAVIGIVKNNIDPTRSGKIEVFLLRGNSANQDSPASWVPVNYMSPFFGYTENESGDDYGKFDGNPHSYGMWMTPPDIGTEVLCVFLNGDINFGYYIGALPKPGMTYMTPAVGSYDNVVMNESEAKSYGGATRLPVTEYNNANKTLKDSLTLTLPGAAGGVARKVHSYQAAILFNQGLLKDADRGAISSSSMRESPSHVFGISTPGRPIYQGGYDDTSIGDAIKADAKNENFKIIGRRGGHSLVMDDGDLYGKDQLVRLRTASGHTLMMNDYAQTLLIIHANGQSYIELGREGTIDMYSTNSVNIRTEGDLNLHADRNININATGDLNMSGKNTKVEALQTLTQYAGDTFAGYSKGDYTVKTESNYATEASGDIGHKAKGTIFINGGKKKPNVKINSGEISTTPKPVGQIGVSVLSDTLYDDSKGYNPAPAKLSSIVNRAPAHMPWADAGKGVDVKTNKSSSAAFPSPPSAALKSINASVPSVPENATSTTLAATVPGLTDVSNLTKGLDTSLNNPALTGMVSQMAVQAALGPAGPAVANGGAGILTKENGTKVAGIGNFAFNATQMSNAGVIKPGSDVVVNYALNSGKSLEQAFPNNIFTGQNGVTNLNQYLNDPASQTKSAATLLTQSESSLKSSGIITGNEHATQTAGLIMGVAGLGLKSFSSLGVTNGAGLSTQGLNTNSLGSIAGSPKDLIAGGNFAANLADKSMVALSGIKLGGIDVASSVKGFAAGLFSSVLSAFKPLKANVPQNLTAINAAPPAAAAAGAVAQAAATSTIPGVNTSSLGGLPGGADAISNNSDNPIIASEGIKNISGTVKNISGNITSSQFGSQVAAAKTLASGGTLASLAMGGIDPAQLSKLNSILGAIGHGAVNISLPASISNSFDTAKVASSTKDKLGGKVPSPTFGTGKAPPVNTAVLSQASTLSQSLASEQTNYDKLSKSYQTIVSQYGEDDVKTKTAYADLTKSAQTIESLQSQIANITIV